VLATVPSATLFGVDGRPVNVEVHVANGMPGFTVIGLPDVTCREARDRVRAALISTKLQWPQRKITVSLTPPGVRKMGAGLDLAIAVGLLVADEQLAPQTLDDRAFVGELGLDGTVRPVPGALPLIDALRADEVVVPIGSVVEARLVARHRVRVAIDLEGLVLALSGRADWPPLPVPPTDRSAADVRGPDLSDVRGQPIARCALEVAAAGGHHLLLVGPPGAGKTMLARRLPGLLPDLPHDQAIEVTRIHSVAGLPLPPGGLVQRPPFRSPTTGRRRSRWWAGAAPCSAPARSPWPTAVSCSWTSWASSTAPCSTTCASRWKRASSGWPGRRSRPASRPGCCWWGR
jgi:magnesium chelatase family protein